ncbi:MAG: flagellin lysine-N-methylase, partial [Peptostreptococcaceae bacterium]
MKKTFLVPEYFLNFKCIGPSCEDTCCKGWNIYIDKDTYKKYSAIASNKTDLGLKLKNNIKKFDEKNINHYGKFSLDESGRCKFLSSNLLCEIQEKLGGMFLCNTCKHYPRMYSTINDDAEAYLTLSCPEAARQALLNENGISFYQHDISFFETLPKTINIVDFNKTVLEKYFFDIRIFTIQLLQNRNYSIEERLGILGI